MNTIAAFDIKINPISKLDFVAIIEDGIQRNKLIVQSGVNAASLVDLKGNLPLIAAYNNADLINIDGMAVVWGLRFLGFSVPERVACPDLASDVMSLAEKKGYGLFLFGAKETNLVAAKDNIQAKYPALKIAGIRNGYYKPDDELSIVDLINSSNADILFLGMTSPQKELFVEKYKDRLKVKYILGVGGFFDILSGSIKRAPVWMQNSGLEWLYRLIEEPRRMWRRYLIGNVLFLKLVLKEKMRKAKK
ncbi:MAG: WecB/TagA/CpsF family glycosyltransferase [Azonexus sp.]|nr:WecB/TagA/CpsF family glycosyltransferase [Azonexus sp.]